MARHKDATWNLKNTPGMDGAQLAALMDIRDELKKLNSLLHCPNFQAIPFKLDAIRKEVARTDRRLAKKYPLK